MKKSLGHLIDELISINIKVFMLIDKIQKNEHTKEDSYNCQQLNKYRSKLMNAINEFSGDEKIIKL